MAATGVLYCLFFFTVCLGHERSQVSRPRSNSNDFKRSNATNRNVDVNSRRSYQKKFSNVGSARVVAASAGCYVRFALHIS